MRGLVRQSLAAAPHAVVLPGSTRDLHAPARVGSWLCLLALLVQVAGLPLHERQIATIVARSSAGSSAPALPLGGHDDSTCVVCAAIAHAQATAPAEPVALPPTPTPTFQPAADVPIRIPGQSPSRESAPRAPPVS